MSVYGEEADYSAAMSRRIGFSTSSSSHQTVASRPVGLQKAFNNAYTPFKLNLAIPKPALEELEKYTVSCNEYFSLITKRELEKSRFIYLDEGKIKFDTATLPPHGEIITEIVEQVGIQDRPHRLFQSGTGVQLLPASVRQPDGHWTINVARLPTPPPLGTFPINMATNHIAPQLVLEVEVSNESMPILAERDLARYFGPGTGTRWWIGIKVFKSDTGGVHRWWAGHAKRAFVQGAFIDEAEFSPESMDSVENNNDPITIATDKVFHVDVATLVHPCALPPNYPPMLDINLEEIRKVIVSWIQ